MAKCYVLGAGASYGHDESLSNEMRPPLTTEFFIKGSRLGLFTEKKWPRLFKTLEEYLREGSTESTVNPLTAEVDIEKLLSWIAMQFGQLSASTPREDADFQRADKLQGALSETFYFVYDLLRFYSISYTPKFDSYRRLALHYNDDKYSVISLNYDLFFEIAATSVNTPCHYFPEPHHPKSIPVAKIHGSINWINPCQGGIAWGGLARSDFNKIITPIYSNRINPRNMIILPVPDVRSIESADFVRSGTDYDEPGLIPPIGDYKDYDKLAAYKGIWAFAENMLSEVSELVVIGCSIRKEDGKLNDLLSQKVRKGTDVTLVDRDCQQVEARIKVILPESHVKARFPSFAEYAKSL
jgi:hypothetical protein